MPLKQAEEHVLYCPRIWRFFNIADAKTRREDYSPETKEDEYEKAISLQKENSNCGWWTGWRPSFKEALRDNGFEQADIANDPLLASKNFEAGSYDLLIIDIVMPEMDGLGLYEEIRKIDTNVNVCFITAF